MHLDRRTYAPRICGILIGANDVSRNNDGVDIETWETDYRFVLESSREANPNLHIVLLDPFVLRSGRLSDIDVFKKWRRPVERLILVVEQLARHYNAIHIKTQDVFDVAAKVVSPEQWIWDGVHPLPQGHELIARNWLQEVSKRLV